MWARNGTCGGTRQKSADSLYCGRPHRGHGHGGGEPKSVTNCPSAGIVGIALRLFGAASAAPGLPTIQKTLEAAGIEFTNDVPGARLHPKTGDDPTD
jgi:hypothetical protein